MLSLDSLINNPDLPAIDYNSLSANQKATIDDLLCRRASYCRQGLSGDVQVIDELIIEGFSRGLPRCDNPMLMNLREGEESNFVANIPVVPPVKNPLLPPSADSQPSSPGDPDAPYRREYREALDVHVTLGVSEKEYVTSRRIDDGLEQLLPAEPEPTRLKRTFQIS